MAKPIPYDDDEPEQDERDKRKIVLYDDEALKLMQGWTGGQDDPLYAISSTGGWNYAWVFEAAIANIDRDLSRVKKLGRNKYQLGKGTFNKAEIDELAYIRDELQMALDDPESVMVDEARGRRVAAQSGLIGPGSDGLYKYRGASIEVSGWPGHYRATVRFRAQQYDFTSLTQDGVLKLAQQQIDEIAGTGVRAPRHVRDYEAIDRQDRVIAGPFKSYGDAKDAAGSAGAVRFVPSRGKKATEMQAPRADKTQAAFRRLDHFFGSPSAQRKGFSSEDEAAASAATLLAAQMRMSYGTALKIVHEWYRQGGVAEASRGARRAPRAGAKEAGAAYAQDQIGSDHFMDWVRDQMLEASKSPPEDVLPLETKSDAMKIARNMLQQLEWDTRREVHESAEFWKGFRSALDGSREWLADEILEMKGGARRGSAKRDPRFN